MTLLPTIDDAVKLLDEKEISTEDLLDQCLRVIDSRDAELHAWAQVDESSARNTAKQLQSELARGQRRSSLHGIPIGVKDVFDVAGLQVEAGSPVRSGKVARHDAPVVQRLRELGAVIIGKTVTTEFACFNPPPTKNPWNLEHTPGGSSSGSAAAVASGMCFAALGSQTGGSISRPASYCGIVGWKPTFDRKQLHGVVPVTFHLDHIGPLTRSAADLFHFASAFGVERIEESRLDPQRKLRVGVIEDYFFSTASEDVQAVTRSALDSLKEKHIRIELAELPRAFQHLHELHRRIMAVEAALYHQTWFDEQRQLYSDSLASLIEEGRATSVIDYASALQQQQLIGDQLNSIAQKFDLLAVPTTPEVAPKDLSTTGDPRFNSPWSFCGMPTVTIPCGLSPAGMPCGLQFIASRENQAQLLQSAARCEEQLGRLELAVSG
jgi:Asp-tRNA(Asn)/Glu-tRNA(Gln) amidotransferase A subunit family amidase